MQPERSSMTVSSAPCSKGVFALVTYALESADSSQNPSTDWASVCRSIGEEIVAIVPAGYLYGPDVLRAVEQLSEYGSLGAVVIEGESPALIAMKRFLAGDQSRVEEGASLVARGISWIRERRETTVTVLVARYLSTATEDRHLLSTNAADLGVIRLSYASFRIRPEIRSLWLEARNRGEIEFIPFGVKLEADPATVFKELVHRLERCRARFVLITADCFTYCDGFLAESVQHLGSSESKGVIGIDEAGAVDEREFCMLHPELLFARGVFDRSWLRMICEGLGRNHVASQLYEQIYQELTQSGLSTCESSVTFALPERIDLDVNSFTTVGKRFVCRGSSESAFLATGRATQSSEQILQRVGQAVELLHHNNNRQALDILTEVAPLMPELHDVIYAKAIAQLRLGLTADAVLSLQLLVRRVPHHAQGGELLKQLRAQGVSC